ncbi:MAG: hypothetical protein ABIM99_02590 [Candidatus Dojkabacteria bacterium]
MIITDPKLSPSKRLFEILSVKFSVHGFNLKGSTYSKILENRIEKIHLRFLIWGRLVSAEVSWSITFIEVEKVFNVIEDPKRKTFDPTVWNDLFNYSICKQNRTKSEFELNDLHDNSYNDFSINLAAEQIEEVYIEIIEQYFHRHSTLEKLAAEINKTPIAYCELIKNINKRILCGLILSKMLDSNNFDYMYDQYQLFLKNSEFTEKEKYILDLKRYSDILTKNYSN